MNDYSESRLLFLTCFICICLIKSAEVLYFQILASCLNKRNTTHVQFLQREAPHENRKNPSSL